MSLEADGNDFIVQTPQEGTRQWIDVDYFADEHAAKQAAEHLLQSHQVDAVRVLQVKLTGRRDNGVFTWEDDIAEKDER